MNGNGSTDGGPFYWPMNCFEGFHWFPSSDPQNAIFIYSWVRLGRRGSLYKVRELGLELGIYSMRASLH